MCHRCGSYLRVNCLCRIREEFNKLDGGDGFVKLAEMKQMMLAVDGRNSFSTEMEKFFKEADIHDNGLVDFEGFNLLLTKCKIEL